MRKPIPGRLALIVVIAGLLAGCGPSASPTGQVDYPSLVGALDFSRTGALLTPCGETEGLTYLAERSQNPSSWVDSCWTVTVHAEFDSTMWDFMNLARESIPGIEPIMVECEHRPGKWVPLIRSCGGVAAVPDGRGTLLNFFAVPVYDVQYLTRLGAQVESGSELTASDFDAEAGMTLDVAVGLVDPFGDD